MANDFETEIPAGYITIEQAAKQDADPELITLGTFWELHPDVTLTVEVVHEGTSIIQGVIELTDRAAIREVEHLYEDMYRLYGNQDGDSFQTTTGLDPWTPVRLVSER